MTISKKNRHLSATSKRHAVKCSRTAARRKVYGSSRINRNHRYVRSSRDLQVLTFDELTPEQQDKIVKSDRTFNDMCELYSEDQMFYYHEDLEELAGQYKKYGIIIDTNKMYWQSSSQGPYAEWDLKDVFDFESIKSGKYIIDIDTNYSYFGQYEINFDDLYIILCDDDELVESPCDEDELVEYTGSNDALNKVNEIVNKCNEFLDKAWELINDVCTSYPDEEWIRDVLSANEYEFIVDGDSVRPY